MIAKTKNILMLFSWFVALVLVILIDSRAHAQTRVDRPPQFVLLAFDGSLNQDMWQETRAWSQNLKKKGADMRLTYFISGVYFVMPRYKAVYNGPRHGVGRSDIGWGKDDPRDISNRVDQTNLAYQEGHEIASHANGHFDGSSWSAQEWSSEFKQFYNLIFNVFAINHINPSQKFPNGWLFGKENFIGFRAPLLGNSPGMYQTLAQYHYRYDTSKTASRDYWPRKNSAGLWNFPLAEVTIAGTGKRTLSMDYNFYYAQSRGNPDYAHADLFEQQMYDTYINYFNANYNGNRAPIHIGHHFSKWNNGAYWRAMQRFAAVVCTQPEVQCINYRELTEYMDQVPNSVIDSWQQARFEPGKTIRLPTTNGRALQMNLALKNDRGNLVPRIRFNEGSMHYEVKRFINDQEVSARDFNLSKVAEVTAAGEKSQVGVQVLVNGREVARVTHEVSHLDQAGAEVWSEPLENRALMGDLPEAHAE